MKNEAINELYEYWLIPEGRVSRVVSQEVEKMEQRIADLEAQLAEARRRDGLLRAVAEAAWQILGEASQDDVEGSAYCIIHSDYILNVHGFLQTAIDGGAFEDK